MTVHEFNLRGRTIGNDVDSVIDQLMQVFDHLDDLTRAQIRYSMLKAYKAGKDYYADYIEEIEITDVSA